MKIRMNWPEVRATAIVVAATVGLTAWAWYSIPAAPDEAGHAVEDASAVVVSAPLHGIIPPIDRSGITYGVEVLQPAPAIQKESFPEAVPQCTDAIADAKGICQGEPVANPTENLVDEDPIYNANGMIIYADGTWHDFETGFIGCMEGMACDTSGMYQILPTYPEGWPDERTCWLNLLDEVVCLAVTL